MPLRILHFSQDFRSDKPQLGGYSRIYNICRDNNIHYIFTISFREIKVRETDLTHNIKVIEIPIYENNFSLKSQIRNLTKIGNEIHSYILEKEIGIDLFFGHSQLINFFILNSARKKINKDIPIIWEMNAIWGHRKTRGIKDKFILSVMCKVQSFVLRKSKSAILHSNQAKQYVNKIYTREINKFVVITNAVNNSEILALNMVETIEKPSKFVCIGFFDEMNGIPMLLRYIKEYNRNIDIVFYGSGEFEYEVANLEKKNKLHFGGSVKREEMIRKLRDFDFIIIPRLPQIEADLFIPTKLLEAMANGVIPICSDVKGMTEVVTHKDNGIVFKAGNLKELDDSINLALSLTHEEINKMKLNAIETVSNYYNWDYNHQILNSLYQSLLISQK